MMHQVFRHTVNQLKLLSLGRCLSYDFVVMMNQYDPGHSQKKTFTLGVYGFRRSEFMISKQRHGKRAPESTPLTAQVGGRKSEAKWWDGFSKS